MSSFLQYPKDELDEIQADNVILFSVMVVVAVLLLSLLLTVLGCMLFGFRRNSCTLSGTRRKIREEIKWFNLKASTSLAKNQKSLRYLASHPDYNDKFRMIKYISSDEERKDKNVKESTQQKDIEKGTVDMPHAEEEKHEAPQSLEECEELVKDLKELVDDLEETIKDTQKSGRSSEESIKGSEECEESEKCSEERAVESEGPVKGVTEADLPKYTFPKLLIPPLQAQPHLSAPPPEYVFPHLISLKRNQ